MSNINEEIVFSNIKFDITIETEKEYTKTTGKKLENIITNKIDIKRNKENTQKDSKEVNENKGIGVIETSNIKTNNNFISTIQENEKKKTAQEKDRIKNADINFPYIKSELLTNAELQLFHFMNNNLCQLEKIRIFPKVRLGDIVDLDTRLTTDKKFVWKVTNKHVDFLICKADTLEVICVVELDDYTHESQEAKEKDLFIMQVLNTVGIKTFRIRSKIAAIEKSDFELVDECINTELAPLCPYCGIKMIPRKNMRGISRGHRFWGCPNYISEKNKCRYTIDIDKIGEKLP